MKALILLGLGLVLAFEGLALALLPGRMDEVLAALARLGHDGRRRIGVLMLALGVLLVWLARRAGAW